MWCITSKNCRYKFWKSEDRINDMATIVMLAHYDGSHVGESVESILAWTYQNWELLFVAKSNDEALKKYWS